jgi:hypothetical protein
MQIRITRQIGNKKSPTNGEGFKFFNVGSEGWAQESISLIGIASS